jgi:predicted DsbA family dithiol-disulfide isomerase
MSNSRLALETAEFARDKGCYEHMHSALFKAYFTHGQDIGNMTVLLELAQKNGLHAKELETALNQGRYSIQVTQGADEARRLKVTTLPTFFIEDLPPMPGAIDEKAFRKALQNLSR